MRLALVIVAVAVAASSAHGQPAPLGDAVALLPLDADQRLEIYGQPVASEVARALVTGGIDVVVVGPKMAVPERVRLIVDGKITSSGKGDAVALSLHVRDRLSGTVLDTIAATAPSLTDIDAAAADLSAHILPAVKLRLAALNKPTERVATPSKPAVVTPPLPTMLVAVSSTGGPTVGPLRDALTHQLESWARSHHRDVRTVEIAALSRDAAPKTVAKSGSDLGIAFEVVGYDVEPGQIAMARARVQIRISDREQIVFDRVIVTDTILGDRGLALDLLATRVAREVLWIAQPNLRRTVATWR